MGETGEAIDQILAEAYHAIGQNPPREAAVSLLAEVTRIIGIYAEGVKVRPLEVISTNTCGLVLTQETATVDGGLKTWRGVHRWCFEAGRCIQFEVYGQTLVVVPPGAKITTD